MCAQHSAQCPSNRSAATHPDHCHWEEGMATATGDKDVALSEHVRTPQASSSTFGYSPKHLHMCTARMFQKAHSSIPSKSTKARNSPKLHQLDGRSMALLQDGVAGSRRKE